MTDAPSPTDVEQFLYRTAPIENIGADSHADSVMSGNLRRFICRRTGFRATGTIEVAVAPIRKLIPFVLLNHRAKDLDHESVLLESLNRCRVLHWSYDSPLCSLSAR